MSIDNENTNTKSKSPFEKLNKIYDDLTYFDVYSSNLLGFIFLTTIVFLAYSYNVTMINSQEIKTDWVNQRCKPQVMPFAGFINKPEGETVLKYTGDNFTYCIQGILANITGYATQPLTYLTGALTSIFGELSDSINAIRNMVSNIRDSIEKIARNIMSRLMNVMIPLQKMLMSLMDGLNKAQGVLTVSVMMALGSYLTLQTLMGAIADLIIKILIAMAIIIVSLWLGIFTWPLAASTTLIFLAIAVPLTIVVVIMTSVMKVHTDSIPEAPPKPSCFDKNTLIVMNDGTTKPIQNIKVGDILENNNIVKSFLQLSSKNQIMYKYDDIIVSGSHSVYYENEKRWMKVRDCPLFFITTSSIQNIKEKEKENIYCLNTEQKVIPIRIKSTKATKYQQKQSLLFCDWDEIMDNDFLIQKNMNEYLDTGFKYNFRVPLKNGKKKKIMNLKIDDVLECGEIVIGIVEIIKNDNSKLYNLLTNTSTFRINDRDNKDNSVLYNDYNYCIDKYIESKSCLCL
jgi:hypothetical protein